MTQPAPPAPGAPPRFVDLHAHSTASDGSATPTELVAGAHAAGLAAVALTDHDTTAGVDEAQSAGARLGVRVVAGVELSAAEGAKEVHVLGLHIAASAELERQLATFRDTRQARAERMVEVLNGLGVPVRMDRVLAIANEGAIGRPHLARALVEGGWVRDFRDAFDRFLGAGRPAYVPKHRLSVADAIRMIHCAGGIAVLAHPGPEGTRARLESLAAMGLDGVEVRHPGHGSEDTARLGALAEHLRLVPSGGSDWHGSQEGTRMLGGMQVPEAWLERQDARVAERAEGKVA